MVVMILENVPASLRGELSRWFIEPKAGVFVGNVSAMVRERLWTKVCERIKKGGCVMMNTSDTEQGYRIKSHGSTSRSIEDFEGLSLVRIT